MWRCTVPTSSARMGSRVVPTPTIYTGMGRCGVISATHVRTAGKEIGEIFQRSWRRYGFRIVHWGFHAKGKSRRRFGITTARFCIVGRPLTPPGSWLAIVWDPRSWVTIVRRTSRFRVATERVNSWLGVTVMRETSMLGVTTMGDAARFGVIVVGVLSMFGVIAVRPTS